MLYFQVPYNFISGSDTTVTDGQPAISGDPEEPEFVGKGSLVNVYLIPESTYANVNDTVYARFISEADVEDDGTTTLLAENTTENTIALYSPDSVTDTRVYTFIASEDYLVFNNVADINYRIEYTFDY